MWAACDAWALDPPSTCRSWPASRPEHPWKSAPSPTHYGWQIEVDIRSIKSTMKMDILRCKTPEMVQKEIWAHLLAYNLLRTVMAVAAGANGIEPRQVSFKGAKQVVTAFAPKLEGARPEERVRLIEVMLKAIAYHRVGDRFGRWDRGRANVGPSRVPG
jgi:hypothetical protein